MIVVFFFVIGIEPGHGVQGEIVYEISSDSEDEQTGQPEKEMKVVSPEFVEQLIKENYNLRVHVEALQRRVLQESAFAPTTSSTMKEEPSDDKSDGQVDKENRKPN